MESMIVQLTRRPVPPASYMTADSLKGKKQPEWDFVSLLDREKGLHWFSAATRKILEYSGARDMNDTSPAFVEITEEGKRAYLAERHGDFLRMLDGVSSESSLDSFSGPAAGLYQYIHDLEAAYHGKLDLYVYDDNGSVKTFTDFLRGTKEGDTYFIGGFAGYHV